jgi:5-methylcytosine-specific restriction enzyme subunit McrC
MTQINGATEQEGPFVTAHGIPIRNLWHMLLYVWDSWQMSHRWHAEIEKAPSLDALLALILSSLIQQRLRIGLGRDYKKEEAQIAGIRGRVDFARSQNKLAFQHGRAFCRYDTFSVNVRKNQIIRSTLARLVQIGDFGPDRNLAEELRARLRKLVRNLEPVDVIELKPAQIRREQLGRNDVDYRLMLAICGLIAQRQMPLDAPGLTDLPGIDRDSLTLYQLYERFVAKFYTIHLSKDWAIRSQPKMDWPTLKPSQYLPVMNPDVTMQHKKTGKLLVLDTKFTANVLIRGKADLIFNPSHLFQIYAYLRSQEHRSDSHLLATGVLLYPAVEHRISEMVRIQGHDIRWETIDLTQPWETIESDLLSVPVVVLNIAANLPEAVKLGAEATPPVGTSAIPHG